MVLYDAAASALTLHPLPESCASVGDRITIFVHADPRLFGEVRLTTIDATGSAQGAPSTVAFDRGSAVFKDIDAYSTCGPQYLRAEYTPDERSAADGAHPFPSAGVSRKIFYDRPRVPRSCVHSALVCVSPGPATRVVLGPAGWEVAGVTAGEAWRGPVARVVDGRGNVVVDDDISIVLEVAGGGWCRDFEARSVGGYADFGRATVAVPKGGEYRCVASVANTPHFAAAPLVRVAVR